MFKTTIKLTAFVFLVLGLATVMSGGKVAAAGARCPNGVPGFADAQNNLNWGVTPQYNGSHGGNMAGLLIQAYDAQTNESIDTTYHLHSGISAVDPDYKIINGHQTNLNDRIFQDFNGDFNNRVNNYFGGTDSIIHSTGAGGADSVQCHGWDAFGPFDTSYSGTAGNGYVLDCGPTAQPTRFWFTNLPNPAGDGANGLNGYWSIDIHNPNQDFHIDHYTEGSMDFNNHWFQVVNGQNTYVQLIWHPTPQPHGGPDLSTECTHLDITDGGGGTVNGIPRGSGDIRTLVRVYDSSGQVLVHSDTDYNNNGTTQDDFLVINDDTKHWQPPNYVPRGVTLTVNVFRQFKNSSNVWVNIPVGSTDGSGSTYLFTNNQPGDQSRTHTCYSATCSVYEVDGNVPNGPGNAVVQGTQFKLIMTVLNNGPLTLKSPTLNGQAPDNNYDHLDKGDTGYFTFKPTAPAGGPQNYGLNFSFADGDVTDLSVPGCSATVPVFQHFNINPSASIAPGTNQENPYLTDGVTHGVSYLVGGSLSEGQTTTATTRGWLNKNGTKVNGDHVTSDTYGVGISHQYDHPDNGFVAGDQYCAYVNISPANGYHGPAGYADADPHDVTSNPGCVTVTNEPYFKAVRGNISARNGVTPSATSVCPANNNNSGLLAGWNNNQAYGTDRGAGAELSAIALIKITGVASAQTSFTRSATDLTFANNNSGDITSSIDSPSLGGNFGGGPVCTSPPKITPTATLGGTSGVPAAPGDYQTSGSLTLTGGTVSGGGATSILVHGDVYINGDVTYGSNPSWSVDANGAYSGPIFTLVATGNVYIDPSVTQLDGIYVAQPLDATHGGTVYTCATGLSAPSAGYDFYNNCNKQLVVTGTFIGDNIKLLRTFGSLRNEEPNPGPPVGSQLGLAWDSAGPPSFPLPSGKKCTQTREPSDPNTWYDNYLCLPTSAPLDLAWTFDANGVVTDHAHEDFPGRMNKASLIAEGYKYCTQWDIPALYSETWNDNWLCMKQARPDGSPVLQFKTAGDPALSDPTQYCTNIKENGPDGAWATTGYFLCEPLAGGGGGPTANGPPFTSCSNAIVQINTNTCAGEVFQFSPEMYLSSPPPPADLPSNGATRYDAITSLPPVL